MRTTTNISFMFCARALRKFIPSKLKARAQYEKLGVALSNLKTAIFLYSCLLLMIIFFCLLEWRWGSNPQLRPSRKWTCPLSKSNFLWKSTKTKPNIWRGAWPLFLWGVWWLQWSTSKWYGRGVRQKKRRINTRKQRSYPIWRKKQKPVSQG